MKCQSNPIDLSIRVILQLFGLITISCGIAGAQTGILLREGVIIDEVKGEVYMTTPDVRVQAVSVRDGASLWISDGLFKPLALINGRLISQSAGRSNEFSMVELDVNEKGSSKNRYSIDLPEVVQINLRKKPGVEFEIRSRVLDNRVYFSWNYRTKPMRGILDEETMRSDSEPEQRGAFMLNPVSRRLTVIDRQQLPPGVDGRPIVLGPEERLDNVKGVQFVSANEKHLLVSTRVADDSIFNNHRWEIYDRNSAAKVGEVMDYRSYAPFCVVNNVIVYEAGPYIRRVGKEFSEVPLVIVAYDFQRRSQLWEFPILDTVDRGPFPP